MGSGDETRFCEGGPREGFAETPMLEFWTGENINFGRSCGRVSESEIGVFQLQYPLHIMDSSDSEPTASEFCVPDKL